MALFPAFADVKGESSAIEESKKKELDWLSNQSFCPEDAIIQHQRTVESVEVNTQESPHISGPSESESSDRLEQNEEIRSTKRKKKKEKKKKKKHKHHKKMKKKNRNSNSSESDSDIGSYKETSQADSRSSQQDTEKSRQEDQTPCILQGHFVWLDDIETPMEQNFCIDKKPDSANWEYKSLYRGDLARYKRKGNSCLGINRKKQSIIWEDLKAEKKKSQKRVERYYTKSSRESLVSDGLPVYCKEPFQTFDTSAFIPVPEWKDEDAKAPPASDWVNPLGIYDASTTLWLQGKGQLEHENKHPEPGEGREDINTAMLAKVEKFNRKLRENPEDVMAWMEFVSFQDELMKSPSLYSMDDSKSQTHKKSLKVILEKKLAILDRAVESNPDCVELKLARLNICKEFWEASALIKEWQKLVFLHPNSADLWQKYLLFCQSQFTTFSVTKINSIYGKCLSTLTAVQDGSMVSHPALPGTEEAIFAIFLQQCHFLRQAGYSEKAMALFQALIDFTYFKPASVKDLLTKGQIEFFEPFWDSGEPRFGEKGAKGWNAWMRQQERGGWIVLNEPDEEEEDIEDDMEVKDKTLPKQEIWLEVESSREAKQWLPWRPDKTKGQTEEDCEDPDRQILFDDIGPSMFRIASPHLNFQLISSFLQFLGIPAGCGLPVSCLFAALDDISIFDSGLSSERPLTFLDSLSPGFKCIGHMGTMKRERQLIGHCREGEEFIQNVFQQLFPLFSGKEKSFLSLCWLKYEKSKVIFYLQAKNKKKLKSQGKRSKKLVKNLLKMAENRNDLALWKEYAHLEWLLGNVEDSRKVFDTAISMAVGQGLKDTFLCDLCMMYAQLEVEVLKSLTGNEAVSRAVYILTKLAESGKYTAYSGQVSAINILKARKAYEHVFLDWLNGSTASAPAACPRMGWSWLRSLVGCFALFQYLTVGIEAADVIFRQALGKLQGVTLQQSAETSKSSWTKSVTSDLEVLTLMHAALLGYHMQVSIYPLTPLRETLMGALKWYPGNPCLWRLYLQIENKSHNASRARKFFDSMSRTSRSLVPLLFAIRAEQKRKELVDSVQRLGTREVYSTLPETGLTNRIRTLFEHAVQSESGAQCPLLWRMYLHFMVTQGDKERSKGVFYKALQACPWAKALYMDAAEYFPDQLQEFVDLMTEKELRVRVPLEELEILLED